MAVNEQNGIPHRVESLRGPGRDPELGLRADDLLNRHRYPLKALLFAPTARDPVPVFTPPIIPKSIRNTTTEFPQEPGRHPGGPLEKRTLSATKGGGRRQDAGKAA
jgi:hypothetical protein